MGVARMVCAIGVLSACTWGGAESDRAILAVDVQGAGHVVASPVGLACAGERCSLAAAPGTVVTLTAVSDGNSVFERWGGGCSGASTTCAVELTAPGVAVTAT